MFTVRTNDTEALARPRSGSRAALPRLAEDWPLSSQAQRRRPDCDAVEASLEEVRRYASDKAWSWPTRPLIFLCDIHADTDAFLLSLVASGGVRRTGAGDEDYELTKQGEQATFIIGGDCFDKGPATLRLLRCLKHLIDLGADVSILAGNHDLRAYLGLAYAGRRETKLRHLFVRMGRKAMPLFLEVHEAARSAGLADARLLDDGEVRRRLFPGDEWYADFAVAAAPLMAPRKLENELQRIREKASELEATCAGLGLSLGELYAALTRAQDMFLHPGGEFAWYFERMILARREGSLLFVHAGVDDTVARVIAAGGVTALNAWYRRLFKADLFGLYHGPLGNVFRTKYRDIDFPLTEPGLADLRSAGICAIVHGHRNTLSGQRLTLRAGILNFECDASVDRNTRRLEGLRGPGGAAMVFQPGGRIHAISTDYPFVKHFDPTRVFAPISVTADATAERRTGS